MDCRGHQPGFLSEHADIDGGAMGEEGKIQQQDVCRGEFVSRDGAMKAMMWIIGLSIGVFSAAMGWAFSVEGRSGEACKTIETVQSDIIRHEKVLERHEMNIQMLREISKGQEEIKAMLREMR